MGAGTRALFVTGDIEETGDTVHCMLQRPMCGQKAPTLSMLADCSLQPLSCQLHLWSGLTVKKLIVAQLVNKCPAFDAVWKVTAVFTAPCHKTLSGA